MRSKSLSTLQRSGAEAGALRLQVQDFGTGADCPSVRPDCPHHRASQRVPTPLQPRGALQHRIDDQGMHLERRLLGSRPVQHALTAQNSPEALVRGEAAKERPERGLTVFGEVERSRQERVGGAISANFLADAGVALDRRSLAWEGFHQTAHEIRPAVGNREGEIGKAEQIESVGVQRLKAEVGMNPEVTKVTPERPIGPYPSHVVEPCLEWNAVAKKSVKTTSGSVVLLQHANLEAFLGQQQR